MVGVGVGDEDGFQAAFEQTQVGQLVGLVEGRMPQSTSTRRPAVSIRMPLTPPTSSAPPRKVIFYGELLRFGVIYSVQVRW